MHVFLNNMLVPEADAVVSVYDHGYLYGDGIYETMRAYGNIVFMFDRHRERLRRSASLLKLKLPDDDFIKNAVLETLDVNNLSDAYIRITVSRGKGPIGLDPDLCKEPSFVVITEKFREYPEEYYKNGVGLIFSRTKRNLVEAINPMIKSLNFLNNILAKVEAKERGAYEALMLNADGFVTEGTVSNIFFFREDVLCTPSPDAGILDGITRELVINLAREEGFSVNEGLWRTDDLHNASEVFFTNTTSEIMPVSKVDDREYKVGEKTRLLHLAYKEYVEEYVRQSKIST
jgi:branched-chain amino acid aminotransferase